MGKGKEIPEKVFYVCNGSTCKKCGGKEITKQFKKRIKEANLDHIEVIKTKCTDRCKFAPVFSLQGNNEWFFGLSIEEAKAIFEEKTTQHLKK